MAQTVELTGLGVPGAVALTIGTDTAVAALTATGTLQTDALQLISDFSLFGTVGAGSGARLPTAGARSVFHVFNGGANPLLV